jgi:hypothetical protein
VNFSRFFLELFRKSYAVVVFFSLSDYRDNLNDWRVASLLPLQYVGKKTWTFDKLYLGTFND